MAGFSQSIEDAIGSVVKARVKEIAAEETEKAASETRRRIGEEIDRLALHVLKQYDVRDMGDRIQISVRKP